MFNSLDVHDFWPFALAGLLLNLTLGPDTFYILGRTLAQGRRAGVASVSGISAGSVIHTLEAATGLSVLLATSATAFTAVRTARPGCRRTLTRWPGRSMRPSSRKSSGRSARPGCGIRKSSSPVFQRIPGAAGPRSKANGKVNPAAKAIPFSVSCGEDDNRKSGPASRLSRLEGCREFAAALKSLGFAVDLKS